MDVAAFYLCLKLGMKRERICGEREVDKDVKVWMEGVYNASESDARLLTWEGKRVNE